VDKVKSVKACQGHMGEGKTGGVGGCLSCDSSAPMDSLREDTPIGDLKVDVPNGSSSTRNTDTVYAPDMI
jgi:hypothetical protein